MKKQTTRLRRNENLVGWAFVAPTMISFVVLTAFPFLCAMFLSLVEWKFFNGWKKLKIVGIQNFIEIFTEGDFVMALENTFVYVITIVPLSIILSIIFAYCMNGRIFGKKWLRMMFFIPYISSIVAVGTVFKFLFREDGIVNNILMSLSIIAEPIKWNIDPTFSKIPIILLSVWMSIGYQLILFTAAMQNVPVSLYEAGKIDGANSFKQFTKITLPMISPTIFYLVITRTMAVFKIFGSVNVFTMGTTMDSNTSVVVQIYRAAFSSYKFGTASAMAVVLWVLIMIVTALNFWGQKKWVHY
ncbi:MAG: sugar ABC transporter permease [Lachnospiraceae bacterium]|nr:sugar ABC transporter permease [Lachnospiraceae bacterium]